MIDAYEVGVTLVMDNRILVAISQANDKLLGLQNTIMGANAALKRMNGLTRDASAAADVLAKAWGRVAAAAERAAKASGGMGGGMPGGYSATGGGAGSGPRAPSPFVPAGLIGYDGSRALVPYAGGGGGGGAGGGGGGDYIPGYGGGYYLPGPGPTGKPTLNLMPGSTSGGATRTPRNYAADAFKYGLGASFGFGFLKNTFNQAANIDATEAYMRASGFTADQVKQAYSIANQARESIPGSSLAGNLQLIGDLKSIFASPTEAMQYLPDVLKQAIVAENNGTGVAYDEAFSAARAGELSAALNNPKTGQLDPAKFVAFMHSIANVSLLTSGRVGAGDYVAMAQNAGPAVMAQLDNQALFQDMPALILGMGGARAGTALNALASQFKGGKMSQYAARAMHDIGLLPDYMFGKDDKILKQYRYGVGMAMLPKGAIPDMDLYDKDPVAWFNKIMVPAMQSHGLTSLTDQENYLYKTMSRTPGIRMTQDMIANLLLIKKYEDMFNSQNGANSYQTVTANNPQLQAGALGQAWDAFLAAAGNTAMPEAIKLLNSLTDDMNSMGEWAKANPGLSKALLNFAAGLTAISAVFAAG
ncbi:MAG: hypothetical protein KGL35_16190, partial [Bradyrhizobium sp.]|nr:hypothetical protein [Bradyrhizobium sp.]